MNKLSNNARVRPSTLDPRPSTPRRGFTLVELLLVLAVLTVLAAIAWPSVQAMFVNNHLTSGAEGIRAHVARTRIQAIDSTLIYESRYEQGGRRFLVVPHEPDEAALAQMNGGTAAARETGTQSYRLLGTLPEKLRFETSTPPGAMSAQSPAVPVQDWQMTGLQDIGGNPTTPLEAAAWSAPILFYPDGTADNAQFLVTDERKQSIAFDIRGLTGAVSTAPLRDEVTL